MGAVWLGRDEVLGREVAIKRIGHQPGGTSPDLVRAEREARIAARVNHPHVVAVFDLVQEDDQQWLVMEYVDGPTLAELVREQGPMSPDQAAAILAQAAEALSAAHAAGVVHRDVKPSNILVTAEGQVKLSDFGIARAEADASLTQTGLVTGSPAYLAPEVASGQLATPASDVWSLGATLFHTLAGRPPYDVGGNVLGALYKIVHEEPPRLDDAGWLAPLIASSMTHDQAARWSMTEVVEFLRAGPGAAVPPVSTAPLRVVPQPEVPDQPTEVLTPPPSAPPASVAPTRRRRSGGVLPWLVGAAVVALAVMIGLIAYYANQDSPEPPANEDPTSQSPTDTGSPAPEANAADMENFLTGYLTTAAEDPATAFTMLTPEFQAESGGESGYTEFWGRVTNVRDIQVQANADDPDNLTVTYDYTYELQGAGRQDDHVVLRLVFEDGEYLIADEL
jgi:serine/threonine protein kinase